MLIGMALELGLMQDRSDWEIHSSRVCFQKAKELASCKEISSLELINQTLGYARELDRSVSYRIRLCILILSYTSYFCLNFFANEPIMME